MFPFQYFMAFDILKDLRELKEGRKERKKKPGKEEEKKERWMILKQEKQAQLAKNLNVAHLDLLKKALDTAVNIAAKRNVPPLQVSFSVTCTFSNLIQHPLILFSGHNSCPLSLWQRPNREVHGGKGTLPERRQYSGHGPADVPDGPPGCRVWTTPSLLCQTPGHHSRAAGQGPPGQCGVGEGR